MLWAARQLLTPLKYLRIKSGDGFFQSKITYDFAIPAMLTALTCAAFWGLNLSLEIHSHPKLVDNLSSLLALLIAFYMAALAAVSTFERKGIDDALRGDPATLRVRQSDGGKLIDKDLTYRQFISYLFGYLSFVSLCLFILLLVLTTAWPLFENQVTSPLVICAFKHVLDPIFFVLVFFLLWQMVVTSLLGIYFLTERLQSLNDVD